MSYSQLNPSGKIPAKISGAHLLHSKGITGKGITIAILDSGLSGHPDISHKRILTFQDFLHNKTNIYDDYTHGTHVAGIIASSKIGIAPECNIIPLKVLDKNGECSIDILISALQWILDNRHTYRIRIVNISIGGTATELKQKHNRLNTWVARLWDAGLIICCSAGNNGPKPDSISAPGNCPNIITVGSYDGYHFSSAGPVLPYVGKPELSAPGFQILSMKPMGGYITKNGTSMSVPFVSGACALLLQQSPYLTNEQVKRRLMQSAHKVPKLPLNIQGAGMLDLQTLLSR